MQSLRRKIAVHLFPLLVAAAAVLGLLVYGGYRYYLLEEDFAYARGQFDDARGSLERRLASTSAENRDLITILNARTTDFQNELGEKAAKLSALEKLQATDPELLQKYSKVYFLNENYLPAALSLIEPDFVLRPEKPVQIHTQVKTRLESMLRDARSAGIDIAVLSGYRSFGTQAALKSQYSVIYGTNSNRFSADQGYSEHQLGTALDFTTKKSGETLAGFDKTAAYAWLLGNAYRYGFILSYPKGNAYYIFEPWHWRFVGTSLAASLREQGKSFYDLSQRELDTFLLAIFD